MTDGMKRNVIYSIIAAIVLIGGWLVYYTNYTLHISSMSPEKSDLATLTPSLTITLNKEIASVGDVKSSPSPEYIESYSFSGKNITISFSYLPRDTVHIALNNIKSTDNYTLNSSVSFNPKELSADELPENQRTELLKKQDKNTESNADPIQAYIPYSTLQYALTLDVIGQKDTGGNKYGISARLFISEADRKSGEDKAVKTYKKAIDDYLTSKGVNPDNYPITYTIE